MSNLAAAALAFLGLHLLVSGTALRGRIVALTGEKTYTALFAVSTLAALVWLCIAFNRADASVSNTVLFDAGQGFRNTGIVVMALAFALLVPGILRGNPTTPGQEKAAATGVLRITRHPFLWSVTLWSAFHLIAAGTLAATIFFGTFLLLSLAGTHAIDRKVRRKRPADWQVIAAETSNFPFAAIAAGRNRFVAPEYFDWRFSAAVLVFAIDLYFHNALFSMSPFPNGWLP